MAVARLAFMFLACMFIGFTLRALSCGLRR
jgi:hypothetical protein